jgi:hypothetical protein
MVYAKETMITYTWDIFRLDCAPSENGLTNVVKTVHWILQAQDENGISTSINNSYPLPSPSPGAFSDYSTLTKETVIGWLESNLDVGYLKTTLANEIASKYNPPIEPLPIPWITDEEPVIEIGEQVLTGEEDFIGGVLKLEGISEEDAGEPIIEPVSIQETIAPNARLSDEDAPTEQTLEEMIADGYKPNARDGDADGLVQDATKWERPEEVVDDAP